MLSKIFLDISKKKNKPVLTTEHWLHPIQWCELKMHGISFQLHLFLVALGSAEKATPIETMGSRARGLRSYSL